MLSKCTAIQFAQRMLLPAPVALPPIWRTLSTVTFGRRALVLNQRVKQLTRFVDI